MPKTKRDLIKRQMAHAHNNLDTAAKHLIMVHTDFEEVHPDYAMMLSEMINGCLMINQCIDKFFADAWGDDDPNYESLRNVGTPSNPDYNVQTDGE